MNGKSSLISKALRSPEPCRRTPKELFSILLHSPYSPRRRKGEKGRRDMIVSMEENGEKCNIETSTRKPRKNTPMNMPETTPSHFIRNIITEDLKSGKNNGRVHTRFPPEPNGYLHIGHAKAICLNFGLAAEFGGLCNLRFDDTNPSKEDVEYVDSIKSDVRWLGFDWQEREYYASDYFEQLYHFAVQLIQAGKAYVCDLSADEIRDYRGTLTEPGKDS